MKKGAFPGAFFHERLVWRVRWRYAHTPKGGVVVVKRTRQTRQTRQTPEPDCLSEEDGEGMDGAEAARFVEVKGGGVGAGDGEGNVGKAQVEELGER